MAVYTITSLNPGGQVGKVAIAGEALVFGDLLYISATGTVLKADCNGSPDGQLKSTVCGMALNTAAAGQPVNYLGSGEVTVDTSLFAGVGRLFVQSQTAGKMMDAADLAASDWVTHVGYSTSVSKLMIDINVLAIQRT